MNSLLRPSKKLVRSFIDEMPYIRKLRRQIENQGKYRAGHYYSPIPNREEILEKHKHRNTEDIKLPDISLNKEKIFSLLNFYVKYYGDLPFPEKKSPDCRYYYNNTYFGYSDAIYLYCFLRKHSPKKIIEIGSGFSSAVMLDTIDKFFSSKPELTFIEPNPDRLKTLLRDEDEINTRIINNKLQEIPTKLFSSLEAGDLIFIDSSHVVKYGNELQLLMFEILPTLPSGIFVHFHDVFYPFEYPFEWLKEGRYYNENYFLRAFLSNNNEWNIYFFNDYVASEFNSFIKNNMPMCLKETGGSLYIQKH